MLAAPSHCRSLYNAHYSQLVHILQQILNCLHQLVLMTFMYASAVVANGETIQILYLVYFTADIVVLSTHTLFPSRHAGS